MKRKESRRKERVTERGEIDQLWLVGRWWCWLLVAEELVVASVSAWNGGEREGEKNYRNKGLGNAFWLTLDSISFIFWPRNPYLFGVEEWYFFFNGAKSWPLFQLGRIPIIGLEYALWVVKFIGRGCLSRPF